MIVPAEFAGVIGAVLTPFGEDGNVEAAALEREIDFMAGHCDAISVLGAEISEYRLLSSSDRREWLQRGIELVAGRVPVLAGASGARVGEVVELAELAARRGGGLRPGADPPPAVGPGAEWCRARGVLRGCRRQLPAADSRVPQPADGSRPDTRGPRRAEQAGAGRRLQGELARHGEGSAG